MLKPETPPRAPKLPGDKKTGPKKASPAKAGSPKTRGAKKPNAKGPKKKAVRRAPAGAPSPELSGPNVLTRLWDLIQYRKAADPAMSHSARLLRRGRAKVVQKFGEEAIECALEAMQGNPRALEAESADVIYHLLLLWADAGIDPEKVWATLRLRIHVAEGIAQPGESTKIP